MNVWRVAGILCLVGIEALLYGYSYPFFSLALEKRDLANWMIGLNASVAGIGMLIVGPLLPGLIARFGVNILVAGLFAASFFAFSTLLLADNLIVWFVARFILGACFAALWAASEIWLNGVADERHRGRIVGASSTLYATCQFLGPLALGEIGVVGSLPILVAMAPLAIGVLLALSIRHSAARAKEEEDENTLGDARSLSLALTVAAGLLAAAFFGGIGETAMRSLLPIYGLTHGLDDAGAARLVAAFCLGEAVLAVGLGWIADSFGRRATLRACVLAAALSTLAIPFAAGMTMLLWTVLFFAGGTIAGTYTLGIVLIGQDFRGYKLAVVSAGFATAYSAGSVVGPAPVGFLIDLVGPEALPLAIASGFIGLSTYFFLVADSSERARHDSRAVVPSLKYLEDSRFEDDDDDTAALPAEVETDAASTSESDSSAFHPPASTSPTFGSEGLARESDPQVDHLEERFKRRSAEIAELIARRQKSREERRSPPPDDDA